MDPSLSALCVKLPACSAICIRFWRAKAGGHRTKSRQQSGFLCHPGWPIDKTVSLVIWVFEEQSQSVHTYGTGELRERDHQVRKDYHQAKISPGLLCITDWSFVDFVNCLVKITSWSVFAVEPIALKSNTCISMSLTQIMSHNIIRSATSHSACLLILCYRQWIFSAFWSWQLSDLQYETRVGPF